VSDEIVTVELVKHPECGHQAGPHRCHLFPNHEGPHRAASWFREAGLVNHEWEHGWVGLVGFIGYVPPEGGG
jgi:hypothetical protein